MLITCLIFSTACVRSAVLADSSISNCDTRDSQRSFSVVNACKEGRIAWEMADLKTRTFYFSR